MNSVPTYEFYAEHFTALDEDGFNAVLYDAAAYVDERIAHRSLEQMPEDEVRAYLMAVCAVCDEVADPAVSSYTASKTSETFVNSGNSKVARIIDRHLSSTAGQLLYGAWL